MTIVVSRFLVKRTQSVFNLKFLYQHLHLWLIEHEYCQDDKDASFPETYYYDSRQPKGKYIWIWWRGEHIPRGSPFYKRVLHLDFHAKALKDIEVMQNGKKFKTNHGEINIRVQGILETDYDRKWRNHPILKSFYELFWRRIFWKNLETHKEEMKQEMDDLHDEIKKFFKLFTTQTDTRAFRPPGGLAEEEPYGPAQS